LKQRHSVVAKQQNDFDGKQQNCFA